MRNITRLLNARLFALGSALLMFVVLLAACGANGGTTSGGGTGSGGSGANPSPTAVKGYGSAQGCPSDVVINTLPPTPNIIIQTQQNNTTINAQVGNTIEVRLPFGHKWTGTTVTPPTLQLQQPAGYAVKSQNMCVWRFVAKQSGISKLAFTSQALCPRGSLCPMYIAVLSFTINVK